MEGAGRYYLSVPEEQTVAEFRVPDPSCRSIFDNFVAEKFWNTYDNGESYNCENFDLCFQLPVPPAGPGRTFDEDKSVDPHDNSNPNTARGEKVHHGQEYVH